MKQSLPAKFATDSGKNLESNTFNSFFGYLHRESANSGNATVIIIAQMFESTSGLRKTINILRYGFLKGDREEGISKISIDSQNELNKFGYERLRNHENTIVSFGLERDKHS